MFTRNRPAFAVLEMIIVLGILSAVSALSIPAYREYQIRSDLDKTAQQVTQGLARAKLLAGSGERDSAWGFYVPAGVLYKGDSYAGRDSSLDEVYPMPSTIKVTGLLDVSYAKVTAMPSDTGTIILQSLDNNVRKIQVTLTVDQQSLAANQADVLTICHHHTDGTTETIAIPDATWPYHQSHGDTSGSCVIEVSSASSVGIGMSSSAAASSSSSSSAGGATASSASSVIVVVQESSSSSSSSSTSSSSSSPSSCAKFAFGTNQAITLSTASSLTFKNMLAQITFGAGGPPIPVHVCYSKDGGSKYSPLFGGTGNCSGNGNAYGNAVAPNGTDTKTVSVSSGDKLVTKVNGRYSKNGWLAFSETFTSTDKTGHVVFLRNGDTLADYPSFGKQTTLKGYLTNQGMLNAQGNIVLTGCQILSITELSTLGTQSADFQDDVLLMTFN